MGPLDTQMPTAAAKPRNRKRTALAAGILVAALIPVVQSTLASSISINSDTTIEFGQGVQLVAACDETITATPEASYSNALGASGGFAFTRLILSAVDLEACDGATFTVKLRKADGVVATAGTFIFALDSTVNGTCGAGIKVDTPTPVGLDVSTTDACSYVDPENQIFLYPAASIDSSEVDKITIETS